MTETYGAAWCVAIDPVNGAHVRAQRCNACHAVITQASIACPSCGKRGTLEEFRVIDRGRLHSWSIVHRSYPGIAVPFISAIVDMDDGTVLKGVLRGVEPEPAAVRFDMPVRLVLRDAGRKDSRGNIYISYFFEAA